jgi:cytochrome c
MRLPALASAILLLAGGGLLVPAIAQQSDEADYGGLPPGPGRDEVYDTCPACHSLMIVVQQGLTRDSWEESLVWMVEEQGMPEPDQATWALILDYLAAHYGTDR